MKVPARPKIPLGSKETLRKAEELHRLIRCLRQTDKKTVISFPERESKKTSHREQEVGTTDWTRKQEIKDSYMGVSPTFLEVQGRYVSIYK